MFILKPLRLRNSLKTFVRKVYLQQSSVKILFWNFESNYNFKTSSSTPNSKSLVANEKWIFFHRNSAFTLSTTRTDNSIINFHICCWVGNFLLGFSCEAFCSFPQFHLRWKLFTRLLRFIYEIRLASQLHSIARWTLSSLHRRQQICLIIFHISHIFLQLFLTK